MKKFLLSAAFVLISPSFVFGSSITLEEAKRNLNSAISRNSEEGINYWLAIIDSLNTTLDSTPVISPEEAEKLTLKFLEREKEEKESKIKEREELELRKKEEELLTQLFFEEEKRREKERQHQPNEEFTKSLSSLGLEKSQFSHEKKVVSLEDVNFLRDLIKCAWIFDDKDVHTFNAGIVKPNLKKLLEIGQKYEPSREDIPAENVFKEMREMINKEGDSGKVEDSICVLEAHLKKNPVDDETGIYVPGLLSRVWDLARKNKNFRFSMGVDQEEYNSVQMIVHLSMPEGLKTEGGCFPGYAGRFFRDYLSLLTAVLHIKID